MLLGFLGLIAVGAGLLLIYYSRKPDGGRVSHPSALRHVDATVVPEKQYKKSEDGKVVYLFDDDEPDDGGDSGGGNFDGGDSDGGASGGGRPGSADSSDSADNEADNNKEDN